VWTSYELPPLPPEPCETPSRFYEWDIWQPWGGAIHLRWISKRCSAAEIARWNRREFWNPPERPRVRPRKLNPLSNRERQRRWRERHRKPKQEKKVTPLKTKMLAAPVDIETYTAVNRAAASRRTTAAEWMRQAALDKLERTGFAPATPVEHEERA
jgi:hypothetical protein